jgi:hypothetical protein
MSTGSNERRGTLNHHVRVASLEAAQRLVRFPVFQTGDEPTEISVRPESGTKWSTVRSLQRDGSTIYSLKQYAMDYFGHFGAPNKLYTTKPDRWALYGPTVKLRAKDGSAFHGREWDGIEGASLVTHGIHAELRVVHGRLGAKRSQRILNSLVAVSDFEVHKYDSTPLCRWNWTLGHLNRRPARKNWVGQRIKWILEPFGLQETIRGVLPFHSLTGWEFDCAGVSRTPVRPLVRFFLRSKDRSTALEGTYSEGAHSKIPSAGGPMPPMFEELDALPPQVWGMRSPMLRWARYRVSGPKGQLAVAIPPGRSIPSKDRVLIQRLRELFEV